MACSSSTRAEAPSTSVDTARYPTSPSRKRPVLSVPSRPLLVLWFETNYQLSGHFQGSIFVTDRAREFLEGHNFFGTLIVFLIAQIDLLRGSRFFKDVNLITQRFNNKTKLGFRDINHPQFVPFASVREFDPKLNIRSGQLKLMGCVVFVDPKYHLKTLVFPLRSSDVASFFEPSVACIIKAVAQQRAASETNISVRTYCNDTIPFIGFY